MAPIGLDFGEEVGSRYLMLNHTQNLTFHSLGELADCFIKAGYPDKMVRNITMKVLNSERDISIKVRVDEENDDKIRVISTFKADDHIIKAVQSCEESLKLTQSFRNERGPLFKYVKKVGPNIRSHVTSLKQQALGTERGSAKKCNARGCRTCGLLIQAPQVKVGNKKIKLSKGSCKSYNINYLALCQLCGKPYTGRTIDPMHGRVSGHRYLYYEVLKKKASNADVDFDRSNDLYSLGLHLHLDHGLTDPNAFNKYFKFGILEVVNPGDIEKKEFKWMHKLNSFQPHGINVEYPFGIPYIGQC